MARCLPRILALVGAFLAIAPAAQAAGQCGLPDAAPWWIDFSDGSVSFRDSVFKHPGVIAASTGAQAPASLRAGGAQTVYWYMHLDAIVGSPAAPAAAAGIPAAAAQLLAAAQTSSDCATPVIALNEMAGQDSAAPWSPGTTAYRENILALVTALTIGGARPFLLVPGTPYPPNVAGAAALWWQKLAQVSDIVLEVYAAAPKISSAGSLLGSRALRVSFRTALQSFLSISVPAGKLGVMLGFQSGLGYAGREGLQPTDSWLEVVKLEALAARQVAGELGVAVGLVVGVGDVRLQRARRGQAARRLHLPVDARTGAVRRPGPGRRRLQRLARRGADPARGRRAVPDRAEARRSRPPRSIGSLGSRAVARPRSARCSCAISCKGRKASQLSIRRQEAAIIYGRFTGSRGRYVAALARDEARRRTSAVPRSPTA